MSTTKEIKEVLLKVVNSQSETIDLTSIPHKLSKKDKDDGKESRNDVKYGNAIMKLLPIDKKEKDFNWVIQFIPTTELITKFSPGEVRLQCRAWKEDDGKMVYDFGNSFYVDQMMMNKLKSLGSTASLKVLEVYLKVCIAINSMLVKRAEAMTDASSKGKNTYSNKKKLVIKGTIDELPDL